MHGITGYNKCGDVYHFFNLFYIPQNYIYVWNYVREVK